jgi:ectoine hydroxylase-related dioxygenase (phytanoyl-CoA dioxygenase family)
LELRPGAQAQGLHRDDLVHQGYNTEAKEYSLGRDRSLTFFVACNRTHRGNGATRIVPGSHLWDYSRPPPPADDDTSIVDAEINRGDALIILGSVYHGGGANTTDNERRLVLTCGVTCSYLRQEENQYLANEVENIRRLPVAIQRFIGYSSFPPGVGLVNWDDPLKIINPDYQSESEKN